MTTSFTVLAEKAVPTPTGSTTGPYGSKPQGGAPAAPAVPGATTDAAPVEDPAAAVAHEWAGDLVDPSVDEVTDPADAFAMFLGAEGETSWLDRAPDGTLTGWVEDADGQVYRYSDTDSWAIDVDDSQMTRTEPEMAGGEVDEEGNPLEPEVDENGEPIDGETGAEVESELDGEVDEFGNPLDDGEDDGSDPFATDGEITPEEDVPEDIEPGLDPEATDQQFDQEDGPEDELGNPIEGEEQELDPVTGQPVKKGSKKSKGNPFQKKSYVMATRTL